MFQQNMGAFSFAPGTDLTAPGVMGVTPFSNQFGNQMASNVLGGMDKMMSIGNFGMNVASMVNPALLPMALATNIGKYTTGQFLQGAQQQVAVDNMLNRAFKNRDMGGSYGMGVSREGAKQFTDAMRNMANIPEMMTNDRELLSTFQKLNDMKILQSSKNLKEMTSKFEKAVKTMRQMSMDLNKSMEDMAPIMQQSIQSGFFSFDDIRRNAALNKYTQNVGMGFSEGRIEGLQQFGSSTFRAMGGRRQLGANAARDMAGKLSVAMQQGKLDESAISEYTGKQGEDAVVDIAQQIVSGNARLLQQTEQGKFITAYLAEQDESGKFTGKLDRSKLESMGKVSLDEMSKVANQKLSKGEGAISFTNEMQKGLGANISSQMGAGGLQDIIESITRGKNFSQEQKRKLIADLGGFDMQFTDILISSAKGLKDVANDYQRQLDQNQSRARLASQIEYTSIGAKFDRFKTKINRNVAKPLQEMGGELLTDMSNKFDRMGTAISRGHIGKFLDELNPSKTAYDMVVGRNDASKVTGMDETLASDMLQGTFSDTGILSGTSNKYSNFYNLKKESESSSPFGGIAPSAFEEFTSAPLKDFTNVRGKDKAINRVKQIMTGDIQDLRNEFSTKKKEFDELVGLFKDSVGNGASQQEVIDKLVPYAKERGIDVAAFLRVLAETPEYSKQHGELITNEAASLSRFQRGQIDANVQTKLTTNEIGKLQKRIRDYGEDIGEEINFFVGGSAVSSVFRSGSISLQEAIANIAIRIDADKEFARDLKLATNPNHGADGPKILAKFLSSKGIRVKEEELTTDLIADLHDFAQQPSGRSRDAAEFAKKALKDITTLKSANANNMAFNLQGAETSKLFKQSKLGTLMQQFNEAGSASEKRKIIMDNIDEFGKIDTSLIEDKNSEAFKMMTRLADVNTQIADAKGDPEKLKKMLGSDASKYEKASVQEIEKAVRAKAIFSEASSQTISNQEDTKIKEQQQGYGMDLAQSMAKVNEQNLKFAEAVSSVIEGQTNFNSNITENLKQIKP